MKHFLKFLPAIAAVVILASFVSAKTFMYSHYHHVIAEKSDITSFIQTTGRVQPKNRVDIHAPIPGRAEDILVQEGDKIERGQTLMRMSSSERASMVDAAGVISASEKSRWEKNLPLNPIVAQISGRVIQRLIEPGQSFADSTNLFVLCDRLVVEAPVDETDLARIRLGHPTRIKLDAYPNVILEGRVDSIGFDARQDNSVTTFMMKIEFADVPDYVRVGMNADVSFNLETKRDAVVIPSAALNSRGADLFVLIPKSTGGEPEERIVRVGISDRSRVEVLEGLAPGETILIPKSIARKATTFDGAEL